MSAVPVADRLAAAQGYPAIFRIVKDVVQDGIGRFRTGLMLGLSDLGVSPNAYFGGYYVVGSNAIVLNRSVLRYIEKVAAPDDPSAVTAYAFHVMLHEYLHALGYMSEDEVRPMAHRLTLDALGPEHPATVIADAMLPGRDPATAPAYFRKLAYPPVGWRPAQQGPVEIVKGFDLDATPYIQ